MFEDNKNKSSDEPLAEIKEWGTPLTEAELMGIGFHPGEQVSVSEDATGRIIDIKNYDMDGGTIMALVESSDGKKSFMNVRILNKVKNPE